MKIIIGLGQMNSREDKTKNLKAAETLIQELTDRGAELIMLPEHFNYIGPENLRRGQAEEIENSPSLNSIRELAIKFKVHIHIGSFLEREADSVFNTGVVFDPDGRIKARYRKIHLFNVEVPGGIQYRESDVVSAGRDTSLFTINDFTFGMATCYDLRFPELFRELSRQGADVFLIPAAFTLQTGKDHWELLLRARAVENLCWIAAAGQWGASQPHNTCFGRSMIINPWGIITTQASDGISTVIGEIDLEMLRNIRKTFPALEHRRDDIFQGN